MQQLKNSRRKFITSAAFGTIAITASPVLARGSRVAQPDGALFHRYPSIDDEIVSEIVGASHFNLDRVKELVTPRPELARATWDWGFGDWETALGAASHVGRRDIAAFLMEKGARADIFTFAMLGKYEVVMAMVEAMPGIQTTAGPHGFSLLHHAKTGMLSEDLTKAQKKKQQQLIDYLEKLGNAGEQEQFQDYKDLNKEIYLGDYKYGDGAEEGFTIRLNMRELMSFGKLGKFGGALYRIEGQRFRYNGAPSVEISFQLQGNSVVSLTVHEPGLVLTAKKVIG